MSIPLPPLPRESHGFYVMMSSDTLRARDQKIVRAVLKAAAQAVRDSGVCPYAVADGIEALEFTHHE